MKFDLAKNEILSAELTEIVLPFVEASIDRAIAEENAVSKSLTYQGVPLSNSIDPSAVEQLRNLEHLKVA
jgi:hypothetical protein